MVRKEFFFRRDFALLSDLMGQTAANPLVFEKMKIKSRFY